MRIARSTRCREPKGSADDTAPVEAMHAIEDELTACPPRLGGHGPVGSTACRGNPCDNAVIESYITTLKVADTCSMATDPSWSGPLGPDSFGRRL